MLTWAWAWPASRNRAKSGKRQEKTNLPQKGNREKACLIFNRRMIFFDFIHRFFTTLVSSLLLMTSLCVFSVNNPLKSVSNL